MSWLDKVLSVLVAWTIGGLAVRIFTGTVGHFAPTTHGAAALGMYFAMAAVFWLAAVATYGVLAAWLQPARDRARTRR